jgi:addiction module HigA family antidote
MIAEARSDLGRPWEQRMTNRGDDDFAPVTPGEILADEFLAGYGLSQAALARAIGISPNRIAEIVNNRRRITADTTLRLGLFFGTTPELWQPAIPLRPEDGAASPSTRRCEEDRGTWCVA